MGERIDYERWYPEVPAVLDTRQLADLLHTNEQIIRAWVRDGILSAHRQPGGRKFTFLRHEVFDWLISNRYQPEQDRSLSVAMSKSSLVAKKSPRGDV